jgi:hypothetical protein
MLGGLWYHLALCALPLRFFVFCAIRVVSEESKGLILSVTSCNIMLPSAPRLSKWTVQVFLAKLCMYFSSLQCVLCASPISYSDSQLKYSYRCCGLDLVIDWLIISSDAVYYLLELANIVDGSDWWIGKAVEGSFRDPFSGIISAFSDIWRNWALNSFPFV